MKSGKASKKRWDLSWRSKDSGEEGGKWRVERPQNMGLKTLSLSFLFDLELIFVTCDVSNFANSENRYKDEP